MTMGNRIVVMKDGFVQQVDTPIALFEDPSNLFVATFLGSPQMNILEAELFLDGKTLKAKLNGLDNVVVSFPEIKAKQLANKKYIGEKVLLGIRPEHVRPNEGDLNVYVDVVEHLGDESILYTKMENRKEPLIVKIPFNSKMHANTNIKIAFDMNHVYLFDAETHKAIMGIPSENEMPVTINNNILTIGEQSLDLEYSFVNKLLDQAYQADVNLAIKPEYVSLSALPNSLVLKAKLEFVEQKTGYQAVYYSLKGIEGYFALKARNDETIKLGQEIDLYLPYQRLFVYDQKHTKLNSREDVFENVASVTITNNNGQMKIKMADATLSYPSEGLEDGEYILKFKQDKLLPIFSKKMVKQGHTNPEMDNPHNKIKVSAYDEDVLGTKLLVYVAVNGFEHYCSFVVENNFSVYKMSKFELYVPRDSFTLIKK